MRRYSPGDWYAVVTPSGVALLEPSVPAKVLEKVWHALGDGQGLGAVLGGLTEEFGTTFERIPSFAVASIKKGETRIRLAVRGPIQAVITDGTGECQTFSGLGVTTWYEASLGESAQISLGLSQDLDFIHPIADGVVLASCVRADFPPGAEEVHDRGTTAGQSPQSVPSPQEGEFDNTAAAESVDSQSAGGLASSWLSAAGFSPRADHQVDDGARAEADTEATAAEPFVEPADGNSSSSVTGEPMAAGSSAPGPLASGGHVTGADPAPADRQMGTASATDPEPSPVEVHEAGVATPEENLDLTARPEFVDGEIVNGPAEENKYYSAIVGATMGISSIEKAAIRHEEDSDEESPGSPEDPSPAAEESDPRWSPDLASALNPSDNADPHRGSSTADGGNPASPAVTPWEPGASVRSPGAPALGDHDGHTVGPGQFAELIARSHQGAPQQTAATEVFGVPHHTAPTPVTLLISSGERVVLDRGAIVGRRPQAQRVQGGTAPHLVTVPDPERSISRDHVELRLSGEHLFAIDLKSGNGTWLLRQGQDPIRLHPGEATMVVSGDRLDLGGGVVLSFEGL